MNRTIRRTLAMAVALPLALGACADDEPEMDDLEMETEAPAPAPEPTVPAGPMQIQIDPVEGSGVTGEAIAMHADESVTLDLTLDGLVEGEEYEASIMRGACPTGMAGTTPAEGEDTAMEDMEDIADLELEVEGMSGSATTTLDASRLPADQDAHIAVMGADGALVACGDIRGHGDTGAGMGSGTGATADTAGTGR